MRRTGLQILRSARRPVLRVSHRHNAVSVRSRRDRATQAHSLPSSMHYNRSFGVALVSSLVASGAYFAYRGTPGKTARGELLDSRPTTGLQSAAFSSVHAYSGNPSNTATPFGPEESPRAPRRALVVQNGELYTGTIEGDKPLEKTTDDRGRKVLEMMTPEQATQRLRRNEESYLVGRGSGVVRYDLVQLASNDPIEDDHAEKIIEMPAETSSASEKPTSEDWMFWGVFDGHSGWTTSAKLRQELIAYVARELNSTYTTAKKSTTSPLPTPSSIDAAIKRGFVALDTSIVQHSVTEVVKTKSKAQAAHILAPALSGSCALLSFYDSASKILRVATTGDSRAVLGRRSATNTTKWVAHALSVDQTGANEAEAARLRAEHPDEPGVVRNGRVLGGLEPTRAFGDAQYKWSAEVQNRMKRDYFGRSMSPAIKTPPYVTAEPVVTTTQLYPEKGDFVVMATDGLWEMLTNEEVVGLVGSWLEKHPYAQRPAANTSGASAQVAQTTPGGIESWLRSWVSQKSSGDLPIQQSDEGSDKSGQRAPVRQQQWGSASGPQGSSRFVVEDKNAATHLIRNALGGAERDQVCALLTLPSPYSRRYRDDLTVQVIFFGDGGAEDSNILTKDKITVNEEATARFTDEIKAKL